MRASLSWGKQYYTKLLWSDFNGGKTTSSSPTSKVTVDMTAASWASVSLTQGHRAAYKGGTGFQPSSEYDTKACVALGHLHFDIRRNAKWRKDRLIYPCVPLRCVLVSCHGKIVKCEYFRVSQARRNAMQGPCIITAVGSDVCDPMHTEGQK